MNRHASTVRTEVRSPPGGGSLLSLAFSGCRRRPHAADRPAGGGRVLAGHRHPVRVPAAVSRRATGRRCWPSASWPRLLAHELFAPQTALLHGWPAVLREVRRGAARACGSCMSACAGRFPSRGCTTCWASRRRPRCRRWSAPGRGEPAHRRPHGQTTPSGSRVQSWWIGDFLGALIVTPLVLTVGHPRPRGHQRACAAAAPLPTRPSRCCC